MFAIVLAIFVLAVVVRLVAVVRADRPLSPPRSHRHEIDSPSRMLTVD